MQPAQNVMQVSPFLANRANRGLNLQATAGIGGPQPPRISIAGNRFTLIDAAGNQRPHTIQMIDPNTQQLVNYIAPHIDVVIIGINQNVSKNFYDTAYDPNAEEGPPACFSDNGIGPSTQASKPQAPTCAVCPNNQWGSAVSKQSGKDVKACTDSKKLAVIVKGDPILYQFRIPPATLKALKMYANTIGGYSLTAPDGKTRGADLSDVVTRVSFESQGIMKLEPVEFVDEAMCAAMDAVTQDKMDAVLGSNDKPRSALPAPQATQALPAPQYNTPQPQAPMPMHAPQPVYAPQAQPMPQATHVQPTMQPQPAQFVMAQPVHPGAVPQGAVAPPAAAAKRGRGRPAAAPAPQPQPMQQAPQATIVQGPPAMAVPVMQPHAPLQQFQPAPAGPMPAAPPAQQWTPPAVAAPPGAPAPQPTQFGMVQPGQVAAPDAAMQAAVLDAMNFKPPGQ